MSRGVEELGSRGVGEWCTTQEHWIPDQVRDSPGQFGTGSATDEVNGTGSSVGAPCLVCQAWRCSHG